MLLQSSRFTNSRDHHKLTYEKKTLMLEEQDIYALVASNLTIASFHCISIQSDHHPVLLSRQTCSLPLKDLLIDEATVGTSLTAEAIVLLNFEINFKKRCGHPCQIDYSV